MEQRKYYPLTSGQMILLFSQKYCMKKQINNVCATVNILNSVDEKLLRQAVLLAAMRFPSFNCRFTTQGKEVVQYFADDMPDNVRLYDMTEKTPEEIQTQIDKWSAEPFPNNGMDTALYRIFLMRMPEGKISIYFCVCHMVMDAYALTGYIKYTEQIYKALLEHTPIPEIRGTTVECYQSFYDYMTSERYQKDKEFWENRDQTSPVFTSVNGKNSKEFDKGKKTGVSLRLWQVSADHKNMRIPAEVVEAVQNLCLNSRISPQCAYLLAIRSYLGAVSGTEDVTMMNTVARRATVVQKNAGGTMVNAIPFRTIISPKVSFLEGMQQMYSVQRELYRHSDMPCGEILENMKKFGGKEGLTCHSFCATSVTFQPYFSSPGGILDYSFRREKNGASTMPLYISIMPYDASGDLWANYEYIVGYVVPENVEKLHRFMVKFLNAGAENPEASIEQLTAACL